MGFGEPFGSPFYSGGGASVLVPSQFDAAIAGQPFMLDPTVDNAGWWTGDIPVQRAQADTQGDPSEATLNSEALWRRSRRSYTNGRGQEFADRQESDPLRFHESTGVDPWTENRLSLLPGTDLSLAAAGATYLAVTTGRLYVLDGQTVRYTTDGVTWTAITGTPASAALGIAADGSTVYIAYGANGVYTIAAGAAAAVSYATGTASHVAYVKGRLLVLVGGASTLVYNVTAAGAVTSGNLLLTVPDAQPPQTNQWAAEGPNALYCALQVGDKTRLWRTAVKADGFDLDPPVVAGEIPDGQLVRSLQGYLGSAFLVGADSSQADGGKVWVCDYANTSGDLVVRGSVDTDLAPRAMEPQDRFVWFGGFSGTLGRMDLATNVAKDPAAFIPGHALDLDSGTSGHVYSVVTFQGLRFFVVFGHGVYAESAERVASGALETGLFGFGIGDLKNALYADVRHLPLASGDSIAVEVAADGGAWQAVGASDAVGSVSKTLGLGQVVAETIDLRLTLTGNPTLTLVTVRAVPAPKVGERTRLRVRCWRHMDDGNGQPVVADNSVLLDAPTFLDFVRNLRERRPAVIIQLGSEPFIGIIDGLVRFTPGPKALGDDDAWLGWWNGVADLDVIRVEA